MGFLILNFKGEDILNCRFSDLRYKNVINVIDGTLIGCINDVEMDTCSSKITSIIIYGKFKCFGLLGRSRDVIIPWNDIKIIGEDAVLVRYSHTEKDEKQKLFEWLPNIFK